MARLWWQQWRWFARTQPVQRRRTARLAVETLEARVVLSTFAVTTFTDTTRPDVASLRNAIIAANADTGTADDTIQLKSGTYALTLRNARTGQENAAATGDLDITSTAHQLIIQGQGSTGPKRTVIDASQLGDRILQIVNAGTKVILQDLVLQGGTAVDDGTANALPGTTAAVGGAILNNGGQLKLSGVVLQKNAARAAAGQDARGGAIASLAGQVEFNPSISGLLLADSAAVLDNQAVAGNGAAGAAGKAQGPNGSGVTGGDGGNGGTAQGGGLYCAGGALDMGPVSLTGNTAWGGNGGNGGKGGNGTSVHLPGRTRFGNGGNGGNGGAAQGGALFASGTNVMAGFDPLLDNSATGGTGGDTGPGSTTTGGGAGGNGGDARGGALFLTGSANSIVLGSSELTGNRATAGGGGAISGPGNQGGNGGIAQGGGLFSDNGVLAVHLSTFAHNRATGGAGSKSGVNFQGNGTNPAAANFTLPGFAGGAGGAGQGGGLFAGGGQLSLSEVTLANNNATGGAGAAGGSGATVANKPSHPGKGGAGGAGGNAQGGGLAAVSAATVRLNYVTAAYNTVNAAPGGAGGAAGPGQNDKRQPGVPGTAGAAQGAGVADIDKTGIILQNTLIALNTALLSPAPARSTPFRSDYFGRALSHSHNLIGDGTGSTGFDATAHDQVGTAAAPLDPLLTPLTHNTYGGPATVDLLPHSPAIDAGAPPTRVTKPAKPTDTIISIADAAAIAGDSGGSLWIDGEWMLVDSVDVQNNTMTVTRGINHVSATLTAGDAVDLVFDQRFLPRTANGVADIGAVEYQYDLAITLKAAPAAVKPGGTLIYTITVTNNSPVNYYSDSAAPVVTDVLPPELTFVALTAPPHTTVNVPAKGSTGTVTAMLPLLAPGAKMTLTLTVKVRANATGTITNVVSVGPLWWDVAAANNITALGTPVVTPKT